MLLESFSTDLEKIYSAKYLLCLDLQVLEGFFQRRKRDNFENKENHFWN